MMSSLRGLFLYNKNFVDLKNIIIIHCLLEKMGWLAKEGSMLFTYLIQLEPQTIEHIKILVPTQYSAR
jgi:hypothetical protein